MKSVSGKIHPLKIAVWCILGIILLFICIVLGSLLVQKYIKKSSVPMFAGHASLIVVTGSMNGTINEGDMIIIKRTNDYKLGDIVTYMEDGGGTPITHRLVSYGPEEGTFIAKGDANNTTDTSPVREDQIVGEVVHVIPKVGSVINWFLHGGGIIYLGAMIVVIIAGVYFWNIMKPEPETDTDASEDVTQSKEEHEE